MSSAIVFENNIPVNGDPRVSSWPLMSSPRQTVCLVVLYVLAVKVVGPWWMRDRRPYDVRGWMVAYNAATVLGSCWVAKNLGAYYLSHSWRCEPVDYSLAEEPMKILFVAYVFYLMKFLELLDTVFFVLRKKDSQVTRLHVYHHLIMPLFVWDSVKYGGGGYNVFYMFMNSTTHTLMYSYYGLAALGPRVQKYLWWKRYITKIQLTQFVIGIVFLGQAVLIPKVSCKISLRLVAGPLYLGFQFLYLFARFYARSYSKKRTPAIVTNVF